MDDMEKMKAELAKAKEILRLVAAAHRGSVVPGWGSRARDFLNQPSDQDVLAAEIKSARLAGMRDALALCQRGGTSEAAIVEIVCRAESDLRATAP